MENISGDMNTQRIDYIDTLRFVAVLFIMFTHFDIQCFSPVFQTSIGSRFFDPPAPTHWILYGYTGKYALAMMCIVSGFLVSWKCSQKSIVLEKYIVHRYLRMMLPCFLVTGIMFCISVLIGERFQIGTTIVSAFRLGVDKLNPHLWCIDDIFIGGLISAIYINSYAKKKYFSIGFAGLIGLIVVCGEMWIAGCMVGAASFYVGEWIKKHNLMKWYVMLPLLFVAWFLKRDVDQDIANILYTRNIIGAMIIFLVIYATPILQRMLSWKKLYAVKKISYSLFVTHYITYMIVPILFDVLQTNGVNNIWIIYGITFVIKCVCDIGIALFVYYFGEKKIPEYFVKWGVL